MSAYRVARYVFVGIPFNNDCLVGALVSVFTE